MTALRAHGLTQAAIAKRMGMSEKAVRNWLKRGAAPTWKRQFRRRSVFDPYAAYVLQRWQEGVYEAKQLYEEIRAQGFPGTVRIVQRFVQTLADEPSVLTPMYNWLFQLFGEPLGKFGCLTCSS